MNCFINNNKKNKCLCKTYFISEKCHRNHTLVLFGMMYSDINSFTNEMLLWNKWKWYFYHTDTTKMFNYNFTPIVFKTVLLNTWKHATAELKSYYQMWFCVENVSVPLPTYICQLMVIMSRFITVKFNTGWSQNQHYWKIDNCMYSLHTITMLLYLIRGKNTSDNWFAYNIMCCFFVFFCIFIY